VNSAPGLCLMVPGPLEQRTGGYLYDARMVEGLRRLGWTVTVHNLEGRFPLPDARAEASTAAALSRVPGSARVLIDGLALPAIARSLVGTRDPRQLLALVHHLTSDETGLTALQEIRLQEAEIGLLNTVLGVIVTSEFTASRVEQAGVTASRIRCVVPGTEPAELAHGPGSGQPPALLCVGALIPRKGQDILIRALARLRQHSWSCTLAGSSDRDPGFSRRLRALAEDAGLTDRITFAGECDEAELDDLYLRSSVFVSPSLYEGFGMAIAEGLTRGLPIVSTTGGAIPFTVPPGAGILVSPGDDSALANAISTLLDDLPDKAGEPTSRAGSEARSRLSAAARRGSKSLPGWDQQTQAFARAVLDLAP